MQKIDKKLLAELNEKFKDKPLKLALINWICKAKSEFNCFATLTYDYEAWNKEQVERHCRLFTNRYNAAFGFYRFYKKARRDKTKQAQAICVIEGDAITKRYHVHLFLYKPKLLSLAAYAWKVNRCWYFATNKWGGAFHNDFRPITELAGLADYITKEIKNTNIDALCVNATHVY